MKEIKKKFKSPLFFISMATVAKPSRVDFSKMAAFAMETAKMLKKMKNTKMIIAGYSPNRN
jgi:hypothetical protein